MMFPADENQLDNAVYNALTGAHSRVAQSHGRAVRYPADVAPFMALPREASATDWIDAIQLVPFETYAAVQRTWDITPTGWTVVREFDVAQMVDEDVHGVDDPESVPLGPADVPAMLRLVEDTDPGPFLQRTIELGRYVGIRHGGGLIAMAGERFHLDGWREISAVCTAPGHRGRGLASRLIGTLIGGIHRRHERAFLHVLSTNINAIQLYERLGFRIRGTRTLAVMTPAAAARDEISISRTGLPRPNST